MIITNKQPISLRFVGNLIWVGLIMGRINLSLVYSKEEMPSPIIPGVGMYHVYICVPSVHV